MQKKQKSISIYQKKGYLFLQLFITLQREINS